MYSVYVELKKEGLYSSQVAHPAGAFPGFCSFSWFLQHEVTRSITITPLFPGWDASTLQSPPPPLSTSPGFPDKDLDQVLY